MTAATALGLAWATAVLAGLARWRPAPQRVRGSLAPARGALVPVPRRPTDAGIVGRTATRTDAGIVGPVSGRLDRRIGHLLKTDDPATIRSWRRAGLVTLALLLMVPPLAPVPLVAAWARTRLARHREARRNHQRLEASLPECVDLLALAVGAGCNVSMAVAAVARRGSGPAADALARVVQETGRGRRLADALEELPRRDGEALRPLAAALAGCERYGSPVVAALERLSDEVRRQRQRRAEEAARKVPVLLVFPLVVCILPAFALLTVAPLIASALRELRL